MKKLVFILLMSLLSFQSHSSLPLQVSMFDVVEESDHVLTVKIVGVDMIDGEGRQIDDENAMTGPGKSNTIRLLAQVTKVHLSSADNVPEMLKIPLDPFMHYSFGQVASVYQDRTPSMVVVLKGETFLPAHAGVFGYPEVELETILSLFSSKAKSST